MATLAQLAELVGGKVVGDGNTVITGASTIRDAIPGDLTLVDKGVLARELETCDAAAVMVRDHNLEQVGDVSILPILLVEDVHQAFGAIVSHFTPRSFETSKGISEQAWVDPSAQVASDAVVYPGVFVGANVSIGARSVIHAGAKLMTGTHIGEDVVIYPGAVLYEDTKVGNRVIVHANAVLGAAGFGYATIEGKHILGPQRSNVILEDDVEIGAGTCVDRGSYSPTVIGEGSKIDNLVQVGHNVRVGRGNLFCSQAGIAGSSTTGDYVVFGGQTGVGDHVTIADQVKLGAKAGVIQDIHKKGEYVGAPAEPLRQQFQVYACLQKLPEMRRQIKNVLKAVAQLELQQQELEENASCTSKVA